MKVLVILFAVSACSAQQVWPYMAPWALPSAKLITTPDMKEEVNPLALATPYMHPFGHPLVNPYFVNPGQFPFMWQQPMAAEATKEASRRRRDVSLPLLHMHPMPALAKTTVETKQLEPVEADTPADTTKLELTTKEHELTIPAVRYMQPFVNYKPVKYTAISPASMPFHPGFPAMPYPLAAAPIVKMSE
ncbi:uncharacterized protein [Panulirus ornatus]|uniref:uncharacterized protein n=1 Tax=Panulirus ornatus TaxID=150431 RepID=UPI003A8BEA9D